jgi:ATP-dependent RNA helicase DeaD
LPTIKGVHSVIQTLSDALAQQGYDTLTPVQEAVTDAALGNADLLVSAQTGSGKTVGFGLAIAPTMLGEELRFGPAKAPLALVIAPTRELALQVRRELTWLYAQTGAVVTSCVGGMDMRDERRALDRGAHIVVATPGRLCDHIKRSSIDLTSIRAVVLDEADEMLDLGFREDLEFILGEAPEERRTLMFSATVPRSIASLAKSYQKNAVRVETTAGTSQHADIEYRALNVVPQDIENSIINVLRFYEAKNAIVFCNTRAMVNRLTTRFTNRGFSVVALSGELTQNERTHALQAMRDGRARVCVATDVAARGIDLPNLELVIHADLPSNSDTLLHRSGRTGRAGRKGVSVLIVPTKASSKAQRLLKMAKVTANWANPPSAQDVLSRDEERLLSDPSWTDPVSEDLQDFVAKLVDQFSPSQLAAAYVHLYRSRQSAPEELATPGTAPAPRERTEFGPSTWFSVSVGRNDKAEPRWLLPLLCRAGNITKDDIGAIRIQQDVSYVEIQTSSTAGFLAALGPDLRLEDKVIVTALDKAPELGARAPYASSKPAYSAERPSNPRPERSEDRKPRADRPERSEDRKPRADRPERSEDRKPRADRPERSEDRKPRADRPERSEDRKPRADRPERSERPSAPRPDRPERPSYPRPDRPDRPERSADDRKPRQKKSGPPAQKSEWRPDRAPAGEGDAPRPNAGPRHAAGPRPASGPYGAAKPKGKPAPRAAHDGTQKPPRKFDKRPARPNSPDDAGSSRPPRPAASDPSKRFVPPGANSKPFRGKPKTGGKPAGSGPRPGKGRPTS